ncbi:uncharacterized protein LOC133190640 [Saccostrea echinata]|uniref:uncharacterized protein LOC133190640 n=1 Tax=Saccostrea echinata TaxID=191078 RepID=UPI002A81BDE3|nr:uncharacterized protein LOC133190640 [Saccostrea echinata]
MELRVYKYPLFLFTLLNLLVIHNPRPYSCIYNCCDCGEVSPVNVYITKGSTLVLNCTIEEDSSPYLLMFTFGKNNVDQSEFTEQEKKNIILLKKVVKDFDDQGVYNCYKDDKKVGSSYIEVDYPLQPVNDSDFQCILYDWDDSLSCSWEIGTYKHNGNINVTVIAETSSHPLLYPDKLNNTFCQWKGTFDDPFWYKFYLSVHNIKMNQSIQSNFTRIASSIVKPAPISNVFAENISSTCLTVRWNTRQFKFQVLVFIASDEWNSSIPKKKEARPGDHIEQYLQFCNLIPFTDYTFNITRRKLTMIGHNKSREDGYWSDPAFFTFKTMADVPASPPNITEGSFYHVYGDETILYWKPIKPMDRHGIVISYIISYTSSDGRDKYSLSSQYENITLSLDGDKWYNVSITAITKEGYRSPSASVLIPPKISIPTPSTLVIELSRNRSSASIRWKGSELCQQYIVFWMSSNNLDWKVSPQNSTTLAAPLHNLEKVGVSCSAIVSHSTENPGIVGGGLHWFTCKYFDEKEPALPVAVTVTSSQEALDLSWFIQCDDQSSYPEWFNVTWCDLDLMLGCSQVWNHVLLEPGDRNYRLKGLDSRKTYRVRFSSLSKDGHIKESRIFYDVKPDSKMDRNASDFENNSMIIWITVSLLCALMLVIAVPFAIRKCRSQLEPAIEVPVVPSKTGEKGSGYTNYTSQYSDKRDDNEYRILNDPILMNGLESEKERMFSNNDGHVAKDQENMTDDLEIPDILEDMEKSEMHKKQKSTSQCSDYSKFITASGQTNNSEAFNQSRSQSDSHFNQSKPQSELSSIDFSQSKAQYELSNHSGSSNHNQSKVQSNGTERDITEEEWLDESSAFSSKLEDDYREIRQDSTATDMSAYLYSKSMSSSSHDTNPNVDSYSKVDVNEDINAETDDELLVNLQSSLPNTEQNNGSTESNESSNLSSQQTPAIVIPVEAQQAPVNANDVLTSSADEISFQNLQDSTPQINKKLVNSPQEESIEENSSNSGASLSSSTSGEDAYKTVNLNSGCTSSSTPGDDGYKTVNLNSGCTSSVHSSVYTPTYSS